MKTECTEAQNILRMSDELRTIEEKYQHYNVTRLGLGLWIRKLLMKSMKVDTPFKAPKTEGWFNDCKIKYLEEKMMFSIVTHSVTSLPFDSSYILPFEEEFVTLYDCDGLAEITISVETYLHRFFGAGKDALISHVALLMPDLAEVSEAIATDIDLWCSKRGNAPKA